MAINLSFKYKRGEVLATAKRNKYLTQIQQHLTELEEYLGDVSNEHFVETGELSYVVPAYINRITDAVGHMNQIIPYFDPMLLCPDEPFLGYLAKDLKYNLLPALDQTRKCYVGCIYDTYLSSSNKCAYGYTTSDNFRRTSQSGNEVCHYTDCPHFSGHMRVLKNDPHGCMELYPEIEDNYGPIESYPCSDKAMRTGRVWNAKVSSGGQTDSNITISFGYQDGVNYIVWGYLHYGQIYPAEGSFSYILGSESEYDEPILVKIHAHGSKLQGACIHIYSDMCENYLDIPQRNATGSDEYMFMAQDGSLWDGSTRRGRDTFMDEDTQLLGPASAARRWPWGRRIYKMAIPTETRSVVVPQVGKRDNFSIHPNSSSVLQGTQVIFDPEELWQQTEFGLQHPEEIILGYSGLDPAVTYSIVLVGSSQQLDVSSQSVRIYDPVDKEGTIQTINARQNYSPNSTTVEYDLSSYMSVYSNGNLVISISSLTGRATIAQLFIIEKTEEIHQNYGEAIQLPDDITSGSTSTCRVIEDNKLHIFDSETMEVVDINERYGYPEYPNFHGSWFQKQKTSGLTNCIDFGYFGDELDVNCNNGRYHIMVTGSPVTNVLDKITQAYWSHITNKNQHLDRYGVCQTVKNNYICCEDVGMMRMQASSNTATANGDPVYFGAEVDYGETETYYKLFKFSFGDGSKKYVWTRGQSADRVSHVFTKGGTYLPSVSVHLLDHKGICDIIVVGEPITVFDPIVFGDFTYSLTDITDDYTKVVWSVSVVGGEPPLKYIWDFGDGGTSFSPTPEHQFERGRDVVVSVTIEDFNNNSITVQLGEFTF